MKNLKLKQWHKTAIVGVLAFVAFHLFMAVVIFISMWFDHNRVVFTFPVSVAFHQPMRIEKRNEMVTPVVLGASTKAKALTKEEIIAKYQTKDILMGVWELETTKGKAPSGHHKYCEALGKSNEFGFSPFDYTCFETFEQSVARVSRWFAEVMQEASLEEALCYYNMGVKTSDCQYARNFKAL